MEILLIINIEISIITISIDILIITTNPVKFRKPQKVARLQTVSSIITYIFQTLICGSRGIFYTC